MKVKNQKCIRQLSMKSLWASRKRNVIAIFAIVLTTLLFTSLFTIAMSMNTSYETYQFRQIGGYSHGTFKDVTQKQAAAIAAHPKVKEVGERAVIGVCIEGVFAKTPAEVSYMDKNCTKWSYADPTTGRMPESGKEIAMDTAALKLLGITPKLGTQVTLTFRVGDKNQSAFDESETFTLVGYWEYDDLMPVHYLNVSEDYAKEIEAKGIAAGMQPFRTDLNVMMASGADIRGQMEQVDTDLGYTWETRDGENSVRIGVNWGYTTSQMASSMDMEMVIGIAAFLLLVIFTGYLIIYNIFQISVAGDIRFYGLLKTIGTTPRQLRRIIRQQAMALCVVGIPIGILLGYGVGAVLTPVVMESSTFGASSATLSTSPVIFVGSALFALITVLLSCARPGRMAGKVSPVEAIKYTEAYGSKKKSRTSRGAKLHQMAFANLGRNKSKTILVVVSLALSVVLLNALYTFVGGFSMEKYVDRKSCADFVVSSTDYFRFETGQEEYITEEGIADIKEHTKASLSGSGYALSGIEPTIWVEEKVFGPQIAEDFPEEKVEEALAAREHKGELIGVHLQMEGLDAPLFEKLTVLEGNLDPLFDRNSHAIAIAVEVDDYGNAHNLEMYPQVGDTVPVTYVTDGWYVDSRTGEKSDENTPEEFIEWHMEAGYDLDYTVCALVVVPYSMSSRVGIQGYDGILPAETLEKDSGQGVIPMFYLFDTPDEAAEAEAESYLADLTSDDLSSLMYESKALSRAEFAKFQHMFLLLGGLLCVIIGMVGILNFFNAIMTGILSRRREFAVLQAVGMTNKQLKMMLVYEGLFYALGSVAVAFLLSVILSPLAGNMLGNMFWFFEYHFTMVPVLLMIPIFAFMGWLIPSILYGQSVRHSVVERLREVE